MSPERLNLGELDRRVTRLEQDTAAQYQTTLERYNAALGVLTGVAKQGESIEGLAFRIGKLEQAAEDGRIFRRQLIVAMVGVASVLLGTLLTVVFSLVVH